MLDDYRGGLVRLLPGLRDSLNVLILFDPLESVASISRLNTLALGHCLQSLNSECAVLELLRVAHKQP